MKEEFVQLSNDIQIPGICYGPGIIRNNIYGLSNVLNLFMGKNIVNVKQSINIHRVLQHNKNKIFIDTASAYGNAELTIGKEISKVDREKIVICTKLSANSMLKDGKKAVEKSYFESIKKLHVNHLDIYLMHWPVEGKYIEAWKQMEELYSNGKVKAIGVCNCKIHHLEELLSKCEIKPMINQIECHPLFTQEEEIKWCNNQDIRVMAYTPLARNDDRLANSRKLKKVASHHKKTIPQIILRWHIQLGNIPVVATSNYHHYLSNMDIFNFKLSDSEMSLISGMNINSRLRYDSDNCDFREL